MHIKIKMNPRTVRPVLEIRLIMLWLFYKKVIFQTPHILRFLTLSGMVSNVIMVEG